MPFLFFASLSTTVMVRDGKVRCEKNTKNVRRGNREH